MILVSQNKDTYEIRFPYDANVVNLIKAVPGRSWHPDGKFWSIPTGRLGFLLEVFKGTNYEHQITIQSQEDLNVNASLDAPQVIPNIDISEYDYMVADGCKPYKHQLDSLKYYKYRYTHGLKSGFILADEPGGGKTLQVMSIARHMRQQYGAKHSLIIACVNSAKYNWYEDIIKHSNGTEIPYILGSRLKRDGSIKLCDSKEKLEDLTTMKMYGEKGTDPLPYFLIINIEAIRMRVGKKYPIAERLIELISSQELNLIALDEIHRNCSMNSLSGKQLLNIKKKVTHDCMWIPMTGTPIVSKPTDVFLPLRLVDGHKSNSFYMWCQQFCVYGGFGNHEIIGYKNIKDLKSMLQPNMLRRLKNDVLDLPPKIHMTEYIENTPYQQQLYKQYQADMLANRDEIIHALNPMSKFLRLRQINGSPELVDTSLSVNDKDYLSKNAKLARLLELLNDILSEPNEKVVIFSNWVEPLRTLYCFVKKYYKVCCYTGTMPQEDREKHKAAFINNPEYRILMGTVGALGTSHTLTVARNVIFYDSPWNPADIMQCEDRCHRPGTTNSVNIYTLITKDTVDEQVHKILSKKEGTAMYIVDNELDLRNHPELFDMLLK